MVGPDRRSQRTGRRTRHWEGKEEVWGGRELLRDGREEELGGGGGLGWGSAVTYRSEDVLKAVDVGHSLHHHCIALLICQGCRRYWHPIYGRRHHLHIHHTIWLSTPLGSVQAGSEDRQKEFKQCHSSCAGVSSCCDAGRDQQAHCMQSLHFAGFHHECCIR